MQVRIDEDRHGASLCFPYVEITTERSLKIYAKVRKLPLPKISTEKGVSLESVFVNFEPTLMKLIKRVQRDLGSLSDEEKIERLIEVVRKTFSYPFSGVIESLKMNKPDEARWIEDHFEGDKRAPISEFIEHGYGVCRHYAALFTILAQAVDLDVIMAIALKGVLVNYVREDTGQPLFKAVPLGRVEPGHSWNEVRINGKKWIPVDPTKALNGLNPDHRRVFDKANYLHSLVGLIDIEELPDVKSNLTVVISCFFMPGQEETEVDIEIKLKAGSISIIDPRCLNGGSKTRKIEVVPHAGPLKLHLKTNTLIGYVYTDAEILDIRLAQ